MITFTKKEANAKVILKLLSTEFDKFRYNEQKKKKGLIKSLDYFYKAELRKKTPKGANLKWKKSKLLKKRGCLINAL